MKNIIRSFKVSGIAAFVLFANSLFAQSNEEPSQFNQAIYIVPQYAFMHGIRVDYEMRIKENKWFVLAPQLYTDIDNDGYYYYGNDNYGEYESMFGFGMNTYFKTVVFESDKKSNTNNIPRQSLYFSFGPNFQYFILSNEEEVPRAFIENGVTYYEFVLEDVNKPIYRFGGVADAGWQLAFDRFLLNFYVGLGVKYSFKEGGELIKDEYSEWIDPTYTGILLDGGVKFGFLF